MHAHVKYWVSGHPAMYQQGFIQQIMEINMSNPNTAGLGLFKIKKFAHEHF